MLVLLLTALSVLAAVVPMALYLAAVWWMDRYDREPIWLVLLTFAWGAFVATTLSLLGNTTLDLLLHAVVGAKIASQVTPVVVAPLVEEPTKAAILLLVFRARSFDNATDGFVYGAATGLGFGMTENLLYFITAAQMASFAPLEGSLAWATTVAARTFFSAVMHAGASSVIGAAFGLSRLWSPWARLPTVVAGFGIAVGMHALWNGLLTAASVVGMPALAAADFALLPLQIGLIFAAFQGFLWFESRLLARELAEESQEHGVPPQAHVGALSSVRGRLTAFAPPGVDQALYVRIATRLGFRRAQAAQARPGDRERFARDLRRLRGELRGVLEPVSGEMAP